MKLKIKKLNLSSGRPIAFLDKKTAQNLNVREDNRVNISQGKKQINTLVDISEGLVNEGEIGFSKELSEIFVEKKKVLVNPSQHSPATELIKKKLLGGSLKKNEIDLLISEISKNNLTESEITYFVSGEKLQGMSFQETIYLIEAMVKNGKKLSFNKKIVADKHCIGGIAGNRTTPIVVAICAAAGLTIPKSSSRAITSASGTADVIETISNVELPSEKIKEVVKKTNGCLVWGGGLGLVPSDTSIIKVEKLLKLDIEPQLLASIMSKKIAAGSNHILIDIPYGKGAKISSLKKAKQLGKKFKKIADNFKITLKAVYTKGNKPIGKGIGPVLEMQDVLSVLKNEGPQDLKKKSLFLASELMSLCDIKNSKKLAKRLLETGKAYEKFEQIINSQNGKKDFKKRIINLKTAKFQKTILANKSGKITSVDNKKINMVGRILGTPETITAGLYLHQITGKVKKGDKIVTLYSESKQKLSEAVKYFNKEKAFLIK